MADGVAFSGVHRIALDWGSTQLRAYALDARGAILDTREAGTGVFAIKDRNFEAALRDLIADWIAALPESKNFSDQSARICAAGMIGSANGWKEAPYVRAPARPSDLRAASIVVPFAQSSHALTIISGVRRGDDAMTIDVMRGEETQVFGALATFDLRSGVFCLPGTHNKWVRVEGGAIIDFVTQYTGELYQWLTTQSSVAGVLAVNAQFNEEAFIAGVAIAQREPESLLHHLFQLRAMVVARERDGAWVASAAQGVLIGHDCVAGLRFARGHPEIVLIGSAALTERYARALEWLGVRTRELAADVTVRGLRHILGDAV